MPIGKQTETLAQFEEMAFARHFIFDLRTPLKSVALLIAVCAWLMYGRMPNAWIAIWVGTGVAITLAREAFIKHMRPRLDSAQHHSTVLRVSFWSSLASGLTWGAFALLYIDTSQPIDQLLAGMMAAGLIGQVVTPLSVHLPAFYAFVLPILASNLWGMLRAGGAEQLTLAGMTAVYLSVIARWAHDSHRVHRDSVGLRFENQRLIRDLKERKADAESASRTKSLFLAGISHDLKQPIRAIAMYTGFLRHSAAQGAGFDVAVQTAGKIDIAVESIHRQISRLLELARLESGAVVLNAQWVDLGAVFGRAEELFAGQARAKGIRLQFAELSSRNYQSVETDARMLESILENLISNAVKHTEYGAVYIGTRLRNCFPKGQQLCIEVRDSGVGIAAELLPLVFDAYRSFDDRESSESHGLGLAIARAQASYLGCEITAVSKPGLGSTFTVCGLRLKA